MWTIAGDTVRLATERLKCQIAVARPWEGISDLYVGGSPLGKQSASSPNIFRINAPIQLPRDANDQKADSFTRGNNLVVTFAESPDFPVRRQIKWRCLQQADVRWCGLEVVISLQTELLDSATESTVEAALPAEECWTLAGRQPTQLNLSAASRALEEAPGANFCLLRIAGGNWSYAQMAHASDFAGASVDIINDNQEHPRLTFRLFGPHLEKGVIRRARLRGIFMPRENDLEVASQCYREFLAAAPSLTT